MNLFDNGQELDVLRWQIPGSIFPILYLPLTVWQKYECFVERCVNVESQICFSFHSTVSLDLTANGDSILYYIYQYFLQYKFCYVCFVLVVKQLNGYTKFYLIKDFYKSVIAHLLHIFCFIFGCVTALYIWFMLKYFCKNIELNQQCLNWVQIRMVWIFYNLFVHFTI